MTITILRGKQAPFDVTLTREIIKVKSVKSKLEPDGIGYIRISQFGGDTADGFKKAITDLNHDANGRIKGLVLDLRDDPGGLLTAAVDVAGDLLDGGPVVSIHGRQANDERTFKAPAHGDMLSGVPIAVLINGASASASEIVAGALQDRHRATDHGNSKLRQGIGADRHPAGGTRRGAPHHRALLHPFGKLDPGQRHCTRYRCRSPQGPADRGRRPDQGKCAARRFSQIRVRSTRRPAKAQRNRRRHRKPNPWYSAPIKADLIGKPDDAQLKAAHDHLVEIVGKETGSR